MIGDALLYVAIAALAVGWGAAFVKVTQLKGDDDA